MNLLCRRPGAWPLVPGIPVVGRWAFRSSVTVQGLSANTKYYYHVIVEGVPSTEELTFTTQPEGSEFVLPDGREWELVSPPDKYGGSDPVDHEQGGGGSRPLKTVARSRMSRPTRLSQTRRGTVRLKTRKCSPRVAHEGWSSEDIATPHNEVGGLALGELRGVQFFSPDLSLGLVEPSGETPLPPLPGRRGKDDLSA